MSCHHDVYQRHVREGLQGLVVASCVLRTVKNVDHGWSVIIISIQPWGQFGQEPEPSQATGMALVRCILGKFLGVVCHCFPPRVDFPTFSARCLHVRNDARDPSSER